MAKPIVLDQEWLERIATQVNGLEYGSVLITVHDGRVVQIDRTERKRFDAASNKQQQTQQQQSQQLQSQQQQRSTGSSSGDKLKAVGG
ncbi:YezD family protein [Paenibacillus oenotherae]|uniref:YezD family protein n=2 Tax=Paenibacillus oenotherae TaxID=1435645 RepID=A0ABS7D9M9_9BACL|nr:YezD family protein [Paenibacillus oenotherae]MBW7476643.1 YezD family protein [Paenibacillus oenotherae]